MRRILFILAAGALIATSGCLISITELIPIEFVDVSIDFTDGMVKENIVLADYVDDPSAIHRIEKLDLDAIIENDLLTEDTLDVYISANSSYTDADEVKDSVGHDVFVVLEGYKPPANSTDTLTVPEARKLLRTSGNNWTGIKALLLSGKFTVYLTSTGGTGDGRVIQATIRLTITGGTDTTG
jgi:hypothetical protein